MPSIPAPTSSSPSLPPPPAITPRAQPSPQPTSLVVDLTTLITISDFSAFYPAASPDSFQPIYYPLADGSLVAPPFHDDLTVNNVFLIVTGCLLSIFIRNVYLAAIYLWTGKVKKKGLLYTLFLSQLLGPIAIIPFIVAQFSRSADCAVILRIFFIASCLSLSLLVTGIFGVKAYRCLDNNRLVSIVLVALRTAGTVVLILDVIHIRTLRSLSVLYAVRKSHGPVTVRGRISVRLSLDDVTHDQPTEPRKESADTGRNRRGWSDIRPHTKHFSASWQSSSSLREPSIASIPHDGFQRVHSYSTPGSAETAQNSKRPFPFPSTVHSHPPAPRSWTVRMPTTTDGSHLPDSVAAPFKLSTSQSHSPISRFTRYIPRMSLFREVMRDEVCRISSLWTCSDLCTPP
ncbi:hypothetical protein OG21DRAFT_710042 [Imleria badia]|nr:hypothetical protein OG21DRAFT_710042 [Imleria badia]